MLINLRRELRLRLRQAAVLSAGLGIAVGAGLLTTAGPASAAPAAAGHPAVHASPTAPGRGCQVQVRGHGGRQVKRGRCCPQIIQREHGWSITLRCCPSPVRARHGWFIVGCCPAWVRIPPPGRHCRIDVAKGGAWRRCPAPPPARCRVHIKPGQGG